MNDKQNQGEGDRASARRYERDVKQFVADGKGKVVRTRRVVGQKQFVDEHGQEARDAERKASRGPHAWPTFDELVSRGKEMIERMRARFTKK